MLEQLNHIIEDKKLAAFKESEKPEDIIKLIQNEKRRRRNVRIIKKDVVAMAKRAQK